MMSQLRMDHLVPDIVALSEFRTHGSLSVKLLGSHLLCGNRISSQRLRFIKGTKEDITCRKCLEVLWRHTEFPNS